MRDKVKRKLSKPSRELSASKPLADDHSGKAGWPITLVSGWKEPWVYALVMAQGSLKLIK